MVGERLVALPLADARGVETPGKITTIPGSPPTLAGLTYFRGGIEAVINLPAVWGEAASPRRASARAVLIEAEGMRGILIFDELLDIWRTPAKALNKPLSPRAGITAVLEYDSSEVSLISASDLLRYIEAYAPLNQKL